MLNNHSTVDWQKLKKIHKNSPQLTVLKAYIFIITVTIIITSTNGVYVTTGVTFVCLLLEK